MRTVRNPTSTLGGGSRRLAVAIAVRVVALAVALMQQWPEVIGKATRGFATSGCAQPVGAVVSLDQIASVNESRDRRSRFTFRTRKKAGHSGDARVIVESLSFEPIQELEHFVAKRNIASIAIGPGVTHVPPR